MCSGNCNQGRKPCECKHDGVDELGKTFFIAIGIVTLLLCIAVFAKNVAR